ncbi:hypothetical protein Tco_0978847 [Tanacetum coccineum]|uniref:Uncharacterized protein n=1 Tax=Tanacetum coccineum TaxID=301880 RepID=A0ABQ5EP41_9ASTR
MAASTEALIADYAAAPTPPLPPPSLLTPLSSPLLHIPSLPLPLPSPPLLLPSTAYRDDIPEADMPLRKRARFTAPTRTFAVGESSTTAAARQSGHTLACRVDYEFIDTSEDMSQTLEARITTLEAQVRIMQTQHDKMEWQRQEACDMMTRAYGRIHALEARDPTRPDDLEDTDSSC